MNVKNIVLIISILLPAWGALQAQSTASFHTNAIYLKVVAASNNIPQLIQTLPDMEKLWPQEPETYMRSLNQAAHVLGESLNDPKTKQALATSFTNMMNKACPTNEAEALTWLELKCDTISVCLDCGVINDKSQWLAIAQFLGEIRSKIIPNYKWQGFINPPGVMDPSPEKVKEVLADNERKKTTDSLQTELQWVNDRLSPLFQHDSFFHHGCPFIQPGQPVDTNFINQISAAAHLTDAEKQSLIH